MAGKRVVVTGSTDGVGREVAVSLAALGAHVVVHGRDAVRGHDVAGRIARDGGSAEFIQADFASLAEVRRFADALLGSQPTIDVLINNAGVGSGAPGAPRQESIDGFELRFAVNYLAGFLLTEKLLPRLKASSPSRIVFVSSIGQSPLDFDDLMLTGRYSGIRAYCQSKLAQIMLTVDLARRLAGTGVTVNALHPATLMPTTMVLQSGVPTSSTIAEGRDAILHAAVDPALASTTGVYFEGQEVGRADRQAEREDALSATAGPQPRARRTIPLNGAS